MKRISLAYVLLLLTSLALLAADAPLPAPRPAAPSLGESCSLEGLTGAVLTPDPLLKSFLQAPCYGMTSCPDGSTISCYSPSGPYSGCMTSHGCWVNCFENGYAYCPGTEHLQQCAMY